MEDTDRRIDLRGARDERVFIQIDASPPDANIEGLTIACSTIDVSASGLRLRLPQSIPAQQKLELWVEIKGTQGKFLLYGEVKWSMSLGEEYLCGVALLEQTEVSDLADWQELFK